MNTGSAKGGSRRRKDGPTDAARHRLEGEDFSTCFAELQVVVLEACAARSSWEEKVGVGIAAAIDFVAARPAAASAVTIGARRKASPDQDHEQEVIGYFSALLSAVAPAEDRHLISTDEAIIESIVTIVRGHLLAGTTQQLPRLAPELIYLTLMPYTGIAGARRWADSIAKY